MPEVHAAVAVPGPAPAALALWDDPRRWPAFVDGFRAVARVEGEWPEPGSSITWDSTPHGPGRTREKSVALGVREVESEQLSGTLAVAWEEGEFRVSLRYELKQRSPYALFFVRRALRDALRRTVARYGIERRADAELQQD